MAYILQSCFLVGDLLSCLLGWYVTAGLHLLGYPWIVLVWTAVSEVGVGCRVWSNHW